MPKKMEDTPLKCACSDGSLFESCSALYGPRRLCDEGVDRPMTADPYDITKD